MLKSILGFLILIALFACNGAENDQGPFEIMIGSFSSEQQSIEDSNYYHISLHMAQVWKQSGQNWLYVEQALGSMQDKPYRQRFYLVEETGDGRYKSSVYAIKNDSLFIGKWKTPEYFDAFDQSLLEEREGCAVFLNKTETGYSGSTNERDCTSTLRGASYATSEVEIYPDRISSWDRGFDTSSEQVWGAVKGPYIFDRIQP